MVPGTTGGSQVTRVLANDAAVIEKDVAIVFGRSVMDGAGVGNASVLHDAATILFSIKPTPGISTRTLSPGPQRGEVSGSPMSSMSCGWSVMNSDTSWMSWGIERTREFV